MAGAEPTRDERKTRSRPGPVILAALGILVLIGAFAWVGGRELVRPSGASDTTVTGQPVEVRAVVAGPVQRVTVDPGSGVFRPNVIVARAGTPLEIAFLPGSGCLATVMFTSLKVSQDIERGGIVRLPPLKPGEYGFSCGMQMVFGKIVVK